MAKKSTFGKDPDRLKRLFAVGLEEESAGHEVATASLEQIMEKPGGEIGRYKLLNVLGEGGMGIVYLAEQKHPIRRKVALKVLQPELSGSSAMRGNQRSTVFPVTASGGRKSGLRIPATITDLPSNWIRRPMMEGSPPHCRCQNPYPRIPTGTSAV